MIEQRSVEWFAARLGKVTASRIADVVTRTKSGWSAGRAAYMNQLIAERLSGAVVEAPTTAAMQWGIDHEAEARLAYEFLRNTEVQDASFVTHPTVAMSGASPDGYCDRDGLVEFKCPNTATHVACLIEGLIPERHRLQMLWQMACTGRAWCDYVSYDPRLPEGFRFFVRRLERDDDRIEQLESAVSTFLTEVDEVTVYLRQRYEPRAVAA